MAILQRYQSRFDVLDCYGSLVAIFHRRDEALAFIAAATWRASPPDSYQNEPHRKHAAWRPKRVRS